MIKEHIPVSDLCTVSIEKQFIASLRRNLFSSLMRLAAKSTQSWVNADSLQAEFVLPWMIVSCNALRAILTKATILPFSVFEATQNL